MAKKQTQLEKVLADLDNQIGVLQRSREVIVKAMAQAPKRKTKAREAVAPRMVSEDLAMAYDGLAGEGRR